MKTRGDSDGLNYIKLGSWNNLSHMQFDWSMELHSKITNCKDFQLKRQFPVRPITVLKEK
jgi:hypothetical protein